MKTKLIILAALSATALVASPAEAGGSRHKHYCNCGHTAGSGSCGSSSSSSTSSTSGGSTSSSGGTSSTSGGTSSTSGGTSSSSGGKPGSTGGTAVPEPGMMGMMGMSLVALGIARQRQRRRAA